MVGECRMDKKERDNMNRKPKGHAPYLKAYIAYTIALVVVNVVFWIPGIILGALLSKISSMSEPLCVMLIRYFINIILGYFIFRGIIKSDLLKLSNE